MNVRILLAFCVVCAFLFVACAKPQSTPNSQSQSQSTPTTMADTNREKIGVPECDDFLAAYEACVFSKAPEATRPNYKAAIEHWRFTWRKLAAEPATKATLPQVCKQTMEQARVSSLKDLNCTF